MLAGNKVVESVLLQTTELTLRTPTGRVLVDRLNLSLSAKDKVAIVGRNGVGKSTLLRALAKEHVPDFGRILCHGEIAYVPQQPSVCLREILRSFPEGGLGELERIGLPEFSRLQSAEGLSRGELRKLLLLKAKHSGAQLILLDEPTQDLDSRGVEWLIHWAKQWQGGLLVASHSVAMLREFRNFFVLSESGCRYVPGDIAVLERSLLSEMELGQQKYARTLHRLANQEAHNTTVGRRRRRKKMGGRMREIDRAPSRALLNSKRSYAQESQGKRAKLQDVRIGAARSWAKASRRALAVSLPLTSVVPTLPIAQDDEILSLSNVCVNCGGGRLLGPIDLAVNRERIAVTGDNGAGKTTLLNVMLGNVKPDCGVAHTKLDRVGSIAQGGTDWMLEESLLTVLMRSTRAYEPDEVAHILAAHTFPFALSERPLCSLSPGERVRAALICLFEQSPQVELLIVDEPTYSLDFASLIALRAVLNAWQGGLVIASHDRALLDALAIDQEIVLSGTYQSVCTETPGSSSLS